MPTISAISDRFAVEVDEVDDLAALRVALGFSSAARLRDSPSYPPALWEFSSEREQPRGVTMVVITGEKPK
jgi:hypothetical protein